MKKNLISLAVATSIAGAGSVAVQAQQYLNPEKHGQVLLVPFYNADNGNATNVHIVNTTEDVKAVKIRFVEYKNSEEVLDFNLYLSREDHFAFGVIKNPAGDGAAVITSDNSCTVPALGSANGAFPGTTETLADGTVVRTQPFVNYQYDDQADTSIERTLTGHIEIIEMGVVTSAAYIADATHGPTGVPADCADLDAAWANTPATIAAAASAPEGGLYGLAYHINVEAAAAFGFEPTAIDNWSLIARHTNPGSLQPSLENGVPNAVVHHGVDSDYWAEITLGSGVEATSALLQTRSLMNDVMVNPALGGQTDWVVTFPTKRLHVDPGLVAPFTDAWVGGSATAAENPACEPVDIEQWDREEAFTANSTGFSPTPDAVTTTICNEVAVIRLADESALSAETGVTALSFPYAEGWMRMSFNDQAMGTAPVQLAGLPAIGFAAFKVNNGAMSYGNASEHKTLNVLSGVRD